MLQGIVGARSVKWLERIVVRQGEGDSPWNNYYYKNKSLPPQSDGIFPSCQALPLNSLVLSAKPTKGDPRWPEAITASGVAYSGGSGEPITGVEVSTDRGCTWVAMQLQDGSASNQPPPVDDSSRSWTWVRWHGTVLADASQPGGEVWCRAFTQGGAHGQPETPPQRGGYLYNGWHKVQLDSD